MNDLKPVEDGYQISYTSFSGEVWTLHTHSQVENRYRRVALAAGGWEGGNVNIDVKEVESVNQFGSRDSSFRLPAFDGSLSTIVLGGDEVSSFTMRDWSRAWSPVRDGRLTVVARDGQNRWTPVRLKSMSVPEREPAGRRGQKVDIDWRSLAGCWFGYPQEHIGTVTLIPGGDTYPSVKLRWDGSPTSFNLPSGLSVTLPQITGKRVINLDYGYSGQVTHPDGTVDSGAWSSLRGQLGGLILEPYEKASFVLGSGLTLEVTPRYFSPWG